MAEFDALGNVVRGVTSRLSRVQNWIKNSNWNSSEGNPFNDQKTLVDLNTAFKEAMQQGTIDPEALKRNYQLQRITICKNYVKGLNEQLQDLNDTNSNYEEAKSKKYNDINRNPDLVRRYTQREIQMLVDEAGEKILEKSAKEFNAFLQTIKVNRHYNVSTHADRVELCQHLIQTYTSEMQKAQQKIGGSQQPQTPQQGQDSAEHKKVKITIKSK